MSTSTTITYVKADEWNSLMPPASVTDIMAVTAVAQR